MRAVVEIVEAQCFSPGDGSESTSKLGKTRDARENEMARDRIEMTIRSRDTQHNTCRTKQISCTNLLLLSYKSMPIYAINHGNFTEFNPHSDLFCCSTRFDAATAKGHRICPSRPRRAGFRSRLQMTHPPATHPIHVSCEQRTTLALATSPPEPRRQGVASIS